ncbi:MULTISPECIES: ABC transporter ATP-binding protein [unclassified Polaromonas]|jgi:NitT/TauT family transport system ATP-binding protein/sulfonate transport system ATP-binding protein|uniref:ABC transporter ATP-binding protein n=1 Tax=unclassified Polaromonas TaxID=2638319 RepID=UPI000BCE6E4C|nr:MULTISPECIES: ABC transporter ATP-binding protein [unclassified Polaromonas]OYY37369.1 MAG: sulfonate ABC transporter ATP-binding protein [Polaromonas sp. 35-63-35]OYZ21609.1 MAG: sulfonate ABC transporter ATP-binding protein [Polaromonas sp. 16-63-31]OYZ77752.1 MAG: sulfonate ABC transporter ATP-binding protein [Polaromonas sp. 24-63-21]OZA49921.1 MAG: sulfonate ABC transporter ATP-binding protein [Polaromonas sp. 17-63-33]OZA87090.1 MAG: sulfonate ABC transporter ATP-binding protein [Pola
MLDESLPSADRFKVPALQVSGVDKTYKASNGSVEALRGINLTVAQGEFVCLLGASGCGKSSLLRILAGFEQSTAGHIETYGLPVTGPGPDRGMVFQDYGLFPWLTVRDNIGFGPQHAGRSRRETAAIADRFAEMVGLSGFVNRFPGQLSGGMKQRVAIARVLANNGRILLMDEPFGALDALTRAKLQEELLTIWRETRLTVVFVTHSVEEAIFLADRVVVMSAGPGRIASDIRIDLPRPRDVSSVEFNALRREITNGLSSHLAPQRQDAAMVNA